jgi:SpoU rRNA methylase family enzyme
LLITLIHNSYSSVKLVDAARVCLLFDSDLIVISKATSSAAQTGVPEVEKLAFKRGGKVLYVPDLIDAIELLGPDKFYMVVPKRLGKEKLDFNLLKEELSSDLKVMIGVSGGHTSFSLKELENGYPVYIDDIDENLSPSAVFAIILYSLKVT